MCPLEAVPKKTLPIRFLAIKASDVACFKTIKFSNGLIKILQWFEVG